MSRYNFLMFPLDQLRCKLSCYSKVDLMYSVLRVIEVSLSWKSIRMNGTGLQGCSVAQGFSTCHHFTASDGDKEN